MNNDIIIILTGLTLSIALWLFFWKMKARMSLHVADLVFEPGDLEGFSSFYSALTEKLNPIAALTWMAFHGKELFQQLAKHGHVEILAGFCVDEATTKLVFGAVQSAGTPEMYGQLLVKTVSTISMLHQLEKELPDDPHLSALLKPKIKAHRAEIEAGRPQVPHVPPQSDINPPSSGPNLPPPIR